MLHDPRRCLRTASCGAVCPYCFPCACEIVVGIDLVFESFLCLSSVGLRLECDCIADLYGGRESLCDLEGDSTALQSFSSPDLLLQCAPWLCHDSFVEVASSILRLLSPKERHYGCRSDE